MLTREPLWLRIGVPRETILDVPRVRRATTIQIRNRSDMLYYTKCGEGESPVHVTFLFRLKAIFWSFETGNGGHSPALSRLAPSGVNAA